MCDTGIFNLSINQSLKTNSLVTLVMFDSCNSTSELENWHLLTNLLIVLKYRGVLSILGYSVIFF